MVLYNLYSLGVGDKRGMILYTIPRVGSVVEIPSTPGFVVSADPLDLLVYHQTIYCIRTRRQDSSHMDVLDLPCGGSQQQKNGGNVFVKCVFLEFVS